jgi:hypothetical protein
MIKVNTTKNLLHKTLTCLVTGGGIQLGLDWFVQMSEAKTKSKKVRESHTTVWVTYYHRFFGGPGSGGADWCTNPVGVVGVVCGCLTLGSWGELSWPTVQTGAPEPGVITAEREGESYRKRRKTRRLWRKGGGGGKGKGGARERKGGCYCDSGM